jgi:NADP-dependent 3-hydroxy acid dehydrogenase YdfG
MVLMENRGTLNMIKAFAPLVIETKGVVVNIGSSAGVINVPWNGTSSHKKCDLKMGDIDTAI